MKAKLKTLLVAISVIAVIATVCSSCSSVFGAFGEEAPDVIVLDITATNLSFDDSVYIKYAVAFDKSKVNIDDVHMLIWLEPKDEYTKGTHLIELDNAGIEKIDGVDCIIFEYSGLSASQMTDVVYARAYVEIGGEVCYSDAKKYSILQYAYSMMGKTSAPSDDEKLIALLEDMLSYGELAQRYTDYKLDSLATDDFYQIKIAGGLLNDGFNHGLYKTGETVTINAPETSNGAQFVAWRKKDGTFVSSNATETVTVGTANEVYFAVYEVADSSANLQYILNEDETAYILTGVGNCSDTDIVIPSKIGGKLVTHIADGAFKNCTTIKSVTMGTAIVEIGDEAFSGCSSLSNIYYEGSKAQWNSLIKGSGWSDGTKKLKIKYAIDDSWELGGIPLT